MQMIPSNLFEHTLNAFRIVITYYEQVLYCCKRPNPFQKVGGVCLVIVSDRHYKYIYRPIVVEITYRPLSIVDIFHN